MEDGAGGHAVQPVAREISFSNNWKTLLVSCAASMFEFYDFAVLGFFAYEIGRVLFPPHMTEMQYKAAIYAMFWCGFSTRPMGGALFGYISDHWGRKGAFRFSVVVMAITTFLTGCIPTYSVIGMLAPALLLFLRLIQGLSTGGEISSIFVYLYEIAPKHKRAFWLSLLVVSSVGSFLATLVKITINHTMSEPQILAYGWRIPFWFGILLLFIGWYSKFALKTSPVFKRIAQPQSIQNDDDTDGGLQRSQSWFSLSGYMRYEQMDADISGNPFRVAFCDNLPLTVTFICASALYQSTVYSLNVFLPDYLDSSVMHGWHNGRSYQYNAYVMVMMVMVVNLVGFYTDKYGPLIFLITSSVLTFCIAPVVWYLFTVTHKPWHDLLLMITINAVFSITGGAIFFWFIDTLLIDPRTRTRIFGIAYNVGAVMFGGTAPVLGTFFLGTAGRHVGSILIGAWMSLLAVISSVAYFYGERIAKKQRHLQETQRNLQHVISSDDDEQRQFVPKSP